MLSRRDFVRSGVAVVTAGMAVPSVFTAALAEAERTGAGTRRPRTLVVIQMAGGNDGLNTLVPYRDGAYRRARPSLGLTDDELLPLDDRLALHRALAPLQEAWTAGELAILQGVGYPHPSLSHFEAMDIWQEADPRRARRDGWLSRLVEGSVDSGGHPFNGLGIGAMLPPALCCPKVPPAVVDDVRNYQLLGDPSFPEASAGREEALLRLYQAYDAAGPYGDLFAQTAAHARQSYAALQRISLDYAPAAPYPTSAFGRGLQLVAETIVHDLGVRVAYVPFGGFDTHAGQRREHSRLLSQLAEGLAVFRRDLAAHGRAEDVLIVTWSEFGRRVQENASGGTDHGTAGPMFVLGPVRGGLLGDTPSLTDLDGGNLKHNVDFRSVYATLLESWLDVPSEPILGGRFPTLPLLRS
ncbi:MAG TPA: DUF1501 domain-containing protein [Chloroflexota bacterium]